MNAPDFVLVQGDTLPSWSMTLSGPDGNPLDLRGATLTLRWTSQDFILDGPTDTRTPTIYTCQATIVDALAGEIRIDWQNANAIVTGLFDAELMIAFPGSKQMTIDGLWPKVLYVRKRVGG